MWEYVGGPGTITPHEGTLTLVIYQTPFMHEEIDILLQKLRFHQKLRGRDTQHARSSARTQPASAPQAVAAKRAPDPAGATRHVVQHSSFIIL